METATIKTTLTHTKDNVLILEEDCSVEVEYETSWDIDFNEKKCAVVENETITAFIFEGRETKVRIEKGDLGFNYFTALADMESIVEKIYQGMED